MKKNSLFILVVIMILLLSLSNFYIYADDNNVFTEGETIRDGLDLGLGNQTIDDVSGWVDKKGFEIVILLQRFIQPLSVITFIACSIMVLIGALGNGRMMSGGIWGMIMSMIMYAVVLYAADIMDLFLKWVKA